MNDVTVAFRFDAAYVDVMQYVCVRVYREMLYFAVEVLIVKYYIGFLCTAVVSLIQYIITAT